MPTVLIAGKLRFAVFTRDHEPAHVHVEHPDGGIVILLDAQRKRVVLREADRAVAAQAVRRALSVAQEHFGELMAAWERIHR